MNTNYTYEEIANDYDLWLEFVDTDGNMSRETFDATHVSELVAMMTDMFGAYPNARLTVSIDEDGKWVTDAHIRENHLEANWWDDGAFLGGDEETSDWVYEHIAAALQRGETSGEVKSDNATWTWKRSY